MNSLSVKAKFQIGQCKSLKQIFCKFIGKSDLEGQGHKFLEQFNTTNVKNMHLHRDSNPGPWNTVPML